MAWLLLIIAGVMETAWAVGLKYTEGFTRMGPTLFTIVALAISMFLLGIAARDLPIGTAYPVWVGIGAIGAAVLGMLLFDEPVTAPRMTFLVLLVASIIGLRVTSGSGT